MEETPTGATNVIPAAQDAAGVVQSAQQAQEATVSANPSEEAEIAGYKAEAKQIMLATIEAMRAEIEKVGLYGVQIGEGDRAAFILRVPFNSVGIDLYAKNVNCHTYVVATAAGFRGLEIEEMPANRFPFEQNLIEVINTADTNGIAADGNGTIARQGFEIWSNNWVSGVEQITVPDYTNLPVDDGNSFTNEPRMTRYTVMGAGLGTRFIPVTSAQVTQALETSIEKAQKPTKPDVSEAKAELDKTSSIASTVTGILQSK